MVNLEQLDQQPAVLEGGGAPGLQAVPQQERADFVDVVENHGIDEVAPEIGQCRHAKVAVHENSTILDLYEKNRRLLTMPGQRTDQVGQSGRIGDAQPGMPAVEVDDLNFHDRIYGAGPLASVTSRGPGRGTPRDSDGLSPIFGRIASRVHCTISPVSS